MHLLYTISSLKTVVFLGAIHVRHFCTFTYYFMHVAECVEWEYYRQHLAFSYLEYYFH